MRQPDARPPGPADAERDLFDPIPRSVTAPGGARGGGNVQLVELVFDVVRMDFPPDEVRHARKIWNHVDELRVGAELIPQLARNGVRIGAARDDAWPAIRAVVEVAGAQARRDQLVAQRGLPLMLQLAAVEEGESIFCYQENNRLVGKTFFEGQKILGIDYAFHPELGGCTDLKVGFEVRHDRGELTWERKGGIIEQVPAVDRYVFSEIDVLLTLNADEFLVLGLSDQGENAYLLGSRFLTVEQSGGRYETVLCITPRPVRTRAKIR
jgi:hypothetical protein